MNLKRILKKYGRLYSDILGIKLRSRKPSELFKWFIASILLGARISETLAIRTYRQFKSDGLLSFEKMSKATWDDIVASLDAGGYVRYDFSTASNLQAIVKLLKEKYHGKLDHLHKVSLETGIRTQEPETLDSLLQDFPGVGPVTANIFLRDLRGIWPKADPPLGHLAKKAAKDLGIKDAKKFWKENKVRGYSFANFETALMRIGRESRRKKCSATKLLQREKLY